ncbi:hypothetical protein TD95_000090 [Thielaviopsis punctulata]|uniref:U6 snRNA phosphodiesterase n=1 Tax=Thielaviopsis punctulata TaxID=72032 RepID=A0A0F4Z6U8_9PEZI|nr:hypothetical protein TD95_000090 [Thielaviopsis punctulata]
MPLVDYPSDSDPDSEAESIVDPVAPPPKKRKSCASENDKEARSQTVPPLPQAFLDLYTTNARASPVDDPSLHQGRKRQTPHVAGQWPSHVYIEWHPNTHQHKTLTTFVRKVARTVASNLHTLLETDLGAVAPLHVSLSRPLSLGTAQKDAFLKDVTEGITSARVSPFAISPYRVYWYTSPDSARTFLVLSVAHPAHPANAHLSRFLAQSNATASAFHQPALYSRPQSDEPGAIDREAFHVSVAWTFEVPDAAAKEAVDTLFDGEFAGIKAWDVPVDNVKVKIGNVVHSVPLKRTSRTAVQTNLFT